ncbi:MAG: type II secretion system F family protein [Clostridia bacterium]|nr:type II secretion system F family protein [Clostridia bacterium]
MPLYKCQIIDAHGTKMTVVREAEDEVMLKAGFRRDGIYPKRITELKEKKQSTFFAVSSKVKPTEVINFLRQFSVMVKAGIAISDCINSLRQQKFSAAFKKVLQEVYFDIEAGVLLSEAFGKHPKVFPYFFVSMVGIGEVSGSLDKVLESMADYYENDRRIKQKTKSAMTYPTIVLVLALVIVVFMNLFVLPQFETTLQEFGGELPAITKIVRGISRFFQDYIFLIIPGVVLLVFGIVMFFRTKKGKYVKDWLLFHMPVIGKVQRNLITARFSTAFIILLESGMHMVDCLENLKRMLGNQVFSERFTYTIEEVKRGKPLASSLESTSLFPDMLTEMVSVGEKSGNIEEVLRSTSAYFDSQVESSIAKATAMIEPLMIVGLGAIIGVIILAVLTPMISLMGSI